MNKQMRISVVSDLSRSIDACSVQISSLEWQTSSSIPASQHKDFSTDQSADLENDDDDGIEDNQKEMQSLL